jgi:serine/threonine-protein kinase
MLAAQVMERPAPLGEARREVPAHVAALVMRLLEKEPANRPQSADDVLRALESPDATSWPPNATTEPRSIGVLPFSNVAGDPETEYFSDGMTEELINALARVDGVRVAARTSSFATKGRSLDARELGELLGVATVLDGSVRRAGSRIRVTAHLVDAAAGVQLWSERFDREMRDIFELQDDIVQAIVAALQLQLAGALRPRFEGAVHSRLFGSRRAPIVAAPTQDLEAYDLYLKGRFAWNQRTSTTIVEAVRCFEEAVARDPAFARAHAGLADACLNLPMYTSTPPAVAWQKGKLAATTALALDPSLADVHASLAYGTMLYEWDWVRAEESFRRAIAADERYPTAHHWYGDFLAGRGRLVESVREMRRAHELDPLSRVIGTEFGWTLHLVRRCDEAVAQLESTLRLDPNFVHAHFVLGLVHNAAGLHDRAVAALAKALELGGFYSFAFAALCRARADAGDHAGAARLLAELEARAQHEYVPHYSLAIAYTAVGSVERAVASLHRGVDERDVLLAENLFDPILDVVRREPAYRTLLERMELPTPTA